MMVIWILALSKASSSVKFLNRNKCYKFVILIGQVLSIYKNTLLKSFQKIKTIILKFNKLGYLTVMYKIRVHLSRFK